MEIQQKHRKELADVEAKHKNKLARYKSLLNKAATWFPPFKEMLHIEKLCFSIGFTPKQTAVLMTGKPIDYSEEHKRKFTANDVIAQIHSDKGILTITINLLLIGEWFKQQFERLKMSVGRQTPTQKNRGMNL